MKTQNGNVSFHHPIYPLLTYNVTHKPFKYPADSGFAANALVNKRINKPEILFSHQALPVRMKRIQLKIMLHLGWRACDISLYEQFRYMKTER